MGFFVAIGLALVCILALVNACPELAGLRSQFVQSSSFDLKKVSGVWYEIAYHDLAQIGEKCQIYKKGDVTNATTVSVEGIPEVFGFAYLNKEKPKSMKLFYESTDQPGYFNRFVDAHVVNKMKFPSVIVDVTSSDNYETYDSITEYLCYSVAGFDYNEVRIGYRKPTMPADQLEAIKQKLITLGITNKIRDADQADCVYNV